MAKEQPESKRFGVHVQRDHIWNTQIRTIKMWLTPHQIILFLVLIDSFISVCCAKELNQRFLSETLDHFRKFHPTIGQPCTLVTNARAEDPNTSKIIIDSIPTHLNPSSDHVKNTAWCLLAVFDRSGARFNLTFKAMTRLTEKVTNHATIVLGPKPPRIELDTLRRELFWAEEISENFFLIHVFCGRVSGSFWNYNVSFWNPRLGFGQSLDFLGACPPSLWNQTLDVGLAGIKPMVIPGEEGTDREIRGTDIRPLQIMAEMYNMELNFVFGDTGYITPGYTNATGYLGELLRGEKDVVLPMVLNDAGYALFDCTRFTFFVTLRYVTRHPQKLLAFGNLARGFDSLSWVAVFTFLSMFSMTFAGIFYVYKYLLKEPELYRNPNSGIDFVLMTFTTFVEPDPLPWFPKWSTGRLVVLYWSLFAFLVVNFYTSNLRTNLIAPAYENRIDTTEDFLESGRELFVHSSGYWMIRLGTEGKLKEVIKMLRDEQWRFYPNERMSQDQLNIWVQERGYVIVAYPEGLMLNYLSIPDYEGLPHQTYSKEIIHTSFNAIRFQKYSPITPHLNRILTAADEFGLYYKFLYEYVPTLAMPGQYIAGQINESELRMEVDMILGPIFILICGGTLGTIAFIFELVFAARLAKALPIVTVPTK
ncbi:uncharacterized protein LOC131886976 [Tigriopus californicus]|uniref:uncharacterized protein LOC131886686 n=1 Tax=Tigriopus californicus TaxID=6832 RepID=UPI0027DA0E18|nr:uncharacterized protein LOC131886686 [Tigriopus californicus]XP_059091446.1 uncharacterized protein LOC131886976 [Tigriopus californicus]